MPSSPDVNHSYCDFSHTSEETINEGVIKPTVINAYLNDQIENMTNNCASEEFFEEEEMQEEEQKHNLDNLEITRSASTLTIVPSTGDLNNLDPEDYQRNVGDAEFIDAMQQTIYEDQQNHFINNGFANTMNNMNLVMEPNDNNQMNGENADEMKENDSLTAFDNQFDDTGQPFYMKK